MFSGLFSAYTRRGERPGVGGSLKTVLNAVKPVESLEGISDSHVKSDSSADFSNSVGCGSSVVPTCLVCWFVVVLCGGVFGLGCFLGGLVFVFCVFLWVLVGPRGSFDAGWSALRVLRLVS